MKALPPENEQERLGRLREYDVLDTEPEEALDDIVRLAAQICGVPIAAVTLVDRDRAWFKSQVGLEVQEIPRDFAFCAHTIRQPDLLHITDAHLDPRFSDNPLVTGQPGVRFYAGAPLHTSDGYTLGTLCVIDTSPRELSDEQRQALESLSRVVVTQLEMRRAHHERERLLSAHERALAESVQTAAALRESQRTLSTLMGNLPGMVYRCRNDQDWTIEFVSQGSLDLTGYTPECLTTGESFNFNNLTDPEYRPLVLRQIRSALAEKQSFQLVYPILTREGERKWVWEQGTGVFAPDGALLHIEGFVTDITERWQAEETLRERTEVLENILSTIPHQVFWKDKDSVYQGCNAVFARAAGLSGPEAIVGKKDGDLPWSSLEAETYRQDDLRVISTGEAVIEKEEGCHHEDGTRSVGLTSKVPLHDAAGLVIGVLGVSQDITERKELEAERESLLLETERLLAEAVERADRDPLTGLFNHRAFHKRLGEETARAQREGTSLAVIMLDLDNFKFFNDVYGHLAGDEVLRRVAEELRQHCRSYDIVGRFGGDEFVVLMPGLQAGDAERLMGRLTAKLDLCGFTPPGHDTSIPLNLSAGMAVFPDEVSSRLQVVEVADARLRLSKSGADAAAVAAQRIRRQMTDKVEGFSMLDALVAAVDNKDRYTRRHSEDVLTYSLQIAEALGLDEKTRHTVAVAALLHDVGKIGVPDHVLRKPGKLTASEYEAMQQHPQMGSAIVAAVPGFDETLDAIRHHHERWDGKGYPFGLRGEETPLMAVADAYSAMTSDRPYRKGMGQAKALAILQEGAGSQWDPECVSAFLRAKPRQKDTPGLLHEAA